jgi:hypothetical protein
MPNHNRVTSRHTVTRANDMTASAGTQRRLVLGRGVAARCKTEKRPRGSDRVLRAHAIFMRGFLPPVLSNCAGVFFL